MVNTLADVAALAEVANGADADKPTAAGAVEHAVNEADCWPGCRLRAPSLARAPPATARW